MKHKFEKAAKVIRHIALINQRTLPEDFEEKIQNVKQEKRRKGNVLDILKNRKMRKWSMIVSFHW